MQQLRSLVVFLLLTAVSTAVLADSRARAVSRTSNTIRIGALFSLTGDGSSLGIASEAALNLAVRDINQELEELHSPYRVEAMIEDSKLVPAVAAQQIRFFAARGARVVLGPQSSAEAAAVLPYANAQGVLVVSQGSTASSLAIAGDNLLRLAPNDRIEGAAIAALMHEEGIDLVVPIWRADAGNTGLANSTVHFFTTTGGEARTGVSYAPATTDFSSFVTTLATAVKTARSDNQDATVAVFIASFEEAVDIMNLARLDPDLSAVRWYAADGITQSQAILDNPTAAAFAAATKLVAPSVGLDESLRDRWEPIRNEIQALVGFVPDAFALSVYDAAWVTALSAIEAGNYSDVVRTSFLRNTQRYLGLTGSTALDAAGDRKTATFDFWRVTNVNGTPQWVHIH